MTGLMKMAQEHSRKSGRHGPAFFARLLSGVMLVSVAACASAELPRPEPFPGAPSQPDAPGAPTSPTPTPSTPMPAYTSSGDDEFDAWRIEFTTRARAAGRDPKIIYNVLQGLKPLTAVQTASFDDNQPEFVKPIWDYVKSATSPARVSAGRSRLGDQADMFSRVETAYGVPREILGAIWGMETSYGRILGDFDGPRQLATLAYKGRRTGLGESQLISTMKLLEQEILTREQLKRSSWAGAMGQTQFMPGTLLAYGKDGNGDGKLDIWDNTEDAIASAANYLAKSGWKRNEPWALEATLPDDFDFSLSDGQKHPISYWKGLGINFADSTRATSDALSAELFVPAGARGPVFFLFDNFYKIRVYNNADSYALSIGLLADRLMSRSELTRDWPTDVRLLTRDQVKELQAGLNGLGYTAGVVDGLAGRNTRKALQGFQKDRSLVADGFPTVDMLSKVKAARAG